MNSDIERNLGPQPITNIMAKYKLKPHDIVSSSEEQITHKMVSRAVRGRKLTPNVQCKILKALNKATEKNYTIKDLFNY